MHGQFSTTGNNLLHVVSIIWLQLQNTWLVYSINFVRKNKKQWFSCVCIFISKESKTAEVVCSWETRLINKEWSIVLRHVQAFRSEIIQIFWLFWECWWNAFQARGSLWPFFCYLLASQCQERSWSQFSIQKNSRYWPFMFIFTYKDLLVRWFSIATLSH